ANTGSNISTPSDTNSGVSFSLGYTNGAGTAADFHGAANSGVNGIGRALDFTSNASQTPATGPLAAVANNAALGFGNLANFTATLWFKPDSLGTANNGPVLFVAGPNGTTDAAVANSIGARVTTLNGAGSTATVTLNEGITTGTANFTTSIAANTW